MRARNVVGLALFAAACVSRLGSETGLVLFARLALVPGASRKRLGLEVFSIFSFAFLWR